MCRTIIPYGAVTWSTGRTQEHYLDWQTQPMQARSALFDVYGDHLRARGSEAPVAAVVRLLNPVGIAAPAVRTAISRMVMQGWLEPVQLSGGRGYRATALANQIDRKLWEELPVIPLYQRPTFLAWRGTLRNVVENPSNEGPLWNAETWAYAAEATP